VQVIEVWFWEEGDTRGEDRDLGICERLRENVNNRVFWDIRIEVIFVGR
jgi:hypothetical protein